MNAAEALVVAVVTAIVVADGCIALWAPLPLGLGLRRPRWFRRFWLYPLSLRKKGIV